MKHTRRRNNRDAANRKRNSESLLTLAELERLRLPQEPPATQKELFCYRPSSWELSDEQQR